MNARFEDIRVYLSATPLLGLTVTLIAYRIAYWLYTRAKFHPLLNPVVVSVALLGIGSARAYPGERKGRRVRRACHATKRCDHRADGAAGWLLSNIA